MGSPGPRMDSPRGKQTCCVMKVGLDFGVEGAGTLMVVFVRVVAATGCLGGFWGLLDEQRFEYVPFKFQSLLQYIQLSSVDRWKCSNSLLTCF